MVIDEIQSTPPYPSFSTFVFPVYFQLLILFKHFIRLAAVLAAAVAFFGHGFLTCISFNIPNLSSKSCIGGEK
jgi:hypothetical protein